MESQPKNPEFRNNPELSPVHNNTLTFFILVEYPYIMTHLSLVSFYET